MKKAKIHKNFFPWQFNMFELDFIIIVGVVVVVIKTKHVSVLSTFLHFPSHHTYFASMFPLFHCEFSLLLIWFTVYTILV